MSRMSSYLSKITEEEEEDSDNTVIDITKCLVPGIKDQATDKYIRCKDCDASFLFSIEEQSFFKNKNLHYAPSRCHNCRVLKRTQSKFTRKKTISAVVCISCATLTYVPFKPKGHSPVYCRYCMHKKGLIVG